MKDNIVKNIIIKELEINSYEKGANSVSSYLYH